MGKAMVITIISAMLIIPISSEAQSQFVSPSLKDISEGRYYKGNYVVGFPPQKDYHNPRIIELFLLPEIVPQNRFEDLYVLIYRDSFLKRFVVGDVIKINFRYESDGNWSVSFFKINTERLEEKGWVCCFSFEAFSLVRDLPFSY